MNDEERAKKIVNNANAEYYQRQRQRRRELAGTIGQWVAILFMLAGLIWVASGRSGNLDRVVKDVAVYKAASDETAKGLTEVEKAIIKIQADIGHMQTDIASILTLQRRSLGIPE